jgi:hypothetical protein
VKIENSNLTLSADSRTISSYRLEENIQFWMSNRNNLEGKQLTVRGDNRDQLQLSGSYTSAKATGTETVDETSMVDTKHSAMLKMLEAFLLQATGKKFHLQSPWLKLPNEAYDNCGRGISNVQLATPGFQPAGAGFGLIYSRNEIQMERTRVSFAAEGIVKLADGMEISLNLSFNVDQQIVQQSSFQLKAGDALKDPLVINFGGDLASFTSSTMSFDLDYDGTMDTINQLGAGSGYLVLDKNKNGAVDDGQELFGPQTNDGYSELAKYDEDGNGWIDEGDSIFDQLKIWYHDEGGNSHLVALSEKSVGAIYLGHAVTQMNMYSQNGMAGRLRESGLVLLENGQSRVMQELDVRI